MDLTGMALEGAGLEDLLASLEERCGQPCALVAVHGGVLASSTGPGPAASRPASGTPASDSTVGGVTASAVATAHEDGPLSTTTRDGRSVRVVPVSAGRRRVGALLVETVEGEGGPGSADLADAALALAVVASRRDAEAAVVADEASGLIAELRYGSSRESAAIVRSAQRFGVDLTVPHAAVAFAHVGDNTTAWNAAIRWIETPTRVEGSTAWTVLAGDPEPELRRIRSRLAGIVGGADRIVAAAGTTVEDPAELGLSFREAEVLAAVARARGVDLLTPPLAGVDEILVAVDRTRLERFVTSTLGPLLHDDALVDTLEAWIDSRGSRVGVAETLGVHRNTVGYRMGRVAALLGSDPDDPVVALRLRTAVAALRLLSTTTP